MNQCEQAAGHTTDKCCSSCHGLWEGEGETMPGSGFDIEGYELPHLCCTAANTSREYLKAHSISKKFQSRAGQRS